MKREIVKKTIEAIGTAIKDAIEEQDDYEYEPGCQDADGSYPQEASISVDITFSNAEIYCGVSWRGCTGRIECSIYPSNNKHSLENIEKAVNEWLKKNLDTDALLDGILDSVEDAYEDEWTSHGFRDEADYINYRYG